MLDVGEDRILQTDLSGNVVVPQRPIWRRCNAALENSIRQLGQDSLSVTANQCGPVGILCKKARDGGLVFCVEAMDSAIARKKVRNDVYVPGSAWLRRPVAARCCLLWSHLTNVSAPNSLIGGVLEYSSATQGRRYLQNIFSRFWLTDAAGFEGDGNGNRTGVVGPRSSRPFGLP